MTGTALPPRRAPVPPPWRDVRVLGVAGQLAVLALVGLVAWFLLGNLTDSMTERGLSFVPGFLGTTAGFEIAETTIAYTPTDSYGQALLTGLANTLMVSIAGIILSTILGLLLGIARLSDNWLLARLTAAYVELFRNTPLLVQLFVLYFAVFLQLPAVRDSLVLGDAVFLNQRGITVPRPIPGPGAEIVLAALAGGFLAALALGGWARGRAHQNRRVRHLRPAAVLLILGPATVAWLALPTAPVSVGLAERGTFNIRGGLTVSPELATLVLGLTLYTAAFIAEIVRGGIQAVQRGQLEAARALGLSEGVVLRRVVLPQAMRIIVPPLTSQYLNLLKNSSLAIVVGYPDLFNVSTTVANQTGQPVAVIGLVMLTYLALSLIGSAIMGVVNRRVQLPDR